MKLFDSHAHLDMEPLTGEQEAVIERAHRAEVAGIINIGSSLRGSRASIDLADRYPNIWATVGLHPHDAEEVTDIEKTINELRTLAQSEKVVAIGEIGLDYYYLENPDLKNEQKKLFQAQLALAEELNLPVVIHTREAEEDTQNILKNFKGTGVVHCYTGSPDFAQYLLGLGYYIGFTGFLTFESEKFDNIRKALEVVPIDRLLLETDAPFLAPVPYRGKPNEPSFLPYIAEKAAEIKGVSVEELAEKTTANVLRLFEKIKGI